MVKELCSTLMEEGLKVNGKMISDVKEDMKDILMEMFIRENFKKEKHMDMESKHGPMVRNMMVSGKWESAVETAYG